MLSTILKWFRFFSCVKVIVNFEAASLPDRGRQCHGPRTSYYLLISVVMRFIEFIDYRRDDGRFRLSTHDCQVPTLTFQNLEVEQQI